MTKFKDLYQKGLDRKVNPAVSASDLTDETVLTEIKEYVFTPEIIANLYDILINVKVNQGSHVGIWINGYYGSGKSHFLKYASYCLSNISAHRDLAFDRLIEATQDIMLKGDDDILQKEGVSLSELKSLQNWYVNKAQVEMVMFNIGDVHDTNADRATTFTTIFWNQFNAHRGYNSFHLAFAQYLEKALDDDGKLQEYKDYVKSKGYNWETSLSRFTAGKLDTALQMAKEIDPSLAIDVIRQRIKEKDVNVSVDAFATELKEYIDKKNDNNFRLLFFVDEVSQFIGEHRDLLLQLQSLVKRLNEVCESKVWIACTAQQTLEDVVTGVGGSTTNPEDEVGKILGRFEVRASLQGTKPEYITQQRILEKKGDAEIMLGELYDQDKAKLDAQFVLPSTYQAYSGKEDFIAYYPFVPYQLRLIMKVLDAFVNQGYVDKQVKGNERSLLNITYSVAKETGNENVGQFVSFDQFFGPMLQGSMQHLGTSAKENADKALAMQKDEKKKDFYTRVVNVLFMICNMSETDKQSFPATIDNIVTLLMTEVDASKATIKNDVAEALDYLIDKIVIRKKRTEKGNEIYEFYSEEEAKVAQLIKNQPVDSNTYSEEMYKIIYAHFNPSNKENFYTRSFIIGWNVDGRTFLFNNGEVIVDFLTTASTDEPAQYALSNQNQPNHLVYFLYPQCKKDHELHRNFLEYCRIQRFAQQGEAVSEERRHTVDIFKARAKEVYEKEIKPKFQQILDTCPVISGVNLLTATETTTARGKERYKAIMAKHFELLYPQAQLVGDSCIPKNPKELSAAILRPVEATTVVMPLSLPEKRVKEWLDRQPHDVTVNDVIRQFSKVPYGWSNFASIYIVNELVRRHEYAFNYNNNPNVSREDTARNINNEPGRFTIEKAKAISQEILNQFIEAWKHIFNIMSVKGSNDSTELFRCCKEEDSELNKRLSLYNNLSRKIATYPFVKTVEESISLMEQWISIRDAKTFFETISAANEDAAKLFDRCKRINTFAEKQLDNYKRALRFLTDNHDNFTFLPEELQSQVKSLGAIDSDMEPWDHMPSYLKMMRTLEGQLAECRSQLVKSVKEKYDKVFDDLETYAQSVKVPLDKFARRDSTISQKSQSNNFYALQAAMDGVSKFFEQQMQVINAAIPQPTSSTGATGTETGPKATSTGTKPTVRMRKMIHLHTKTIEPIRNEADADRYLQGLKAEIMQHLKDSDIIIS